MLSADHSLCCQGSKTFLEEGSEQWALGLPSGVGDRVPSIPLLKDSEVSVSPKGARSEYWRRGQSNKVLRLWWRVCWEDLQKNKASSPLMSATWRGIPFQPPYIQHQEDSETTIELKNPVSPAELHLYILYRQTPPWSGTKGATRHLVFVGVNWPEIEFPKEISNEWTRLRFHI